MGRLRLGASEAGGKGRGRRQRARLCGVVDVYDAKALAIAVRPLEIVEEGPRKVAAHVRPQTDGAVHLGRVQLDSEAW